MTNFEKKFWEDALDPFAVIIEQECFHILPDDRPGFKGHGGRRFVIEFTSETLAYSKGQVVVTRNLWHQGKIPDEIFKGNNAKFVKEVA